MDVTPPPKMFEAMSKFTDAVVGEEPSKLDHGPGASKRRENRKMMMDFLHDLVAKAMRVGGARMAQEYGIPTVASSAIADAASAPLPDFRKRH